ncbi:MAG: hypothetical protein KF819_40605 [Labilithrix sp.]|nr:hypothetical protein [Labilithrix sp.]
MGRRPRDPPALIAVSRRSPRGRTVGVCASIFASAASVVATCAPVAARVASTFADAAAEAASAGRSSFSTASAICWTAFAVSSVAMLLSCTDVAVFSVTRSIFASSAFVVPFDVSSSADFGHVLARATWQQRVRLTLSGRALGKRPCGRARA